MCILAAVATVKSCDPFPKKSFSTNWNSKGQARAGLGFLLEFLLFSSFDGLLIVRRFQVQSHSGHPMTQSFCRLG